MSKYKQKASAPLLKKSQISIFLLLGVVIFILFTIIISITNLKTENQASNQISTTDTQEIKSYIEDCLDFTTTEALHTIAKYGGYTNPINKSLKIQNYTINYLYYYGNNYALNKSQIEIKISNYITNNIDTCINSFDKFDHIQIKQKNKHVITNIETFQVTTTLNWDLEIVIDNKNIVLSQIKPCIKNIRLNRMIDTINYITTYATLDPYTTDLMDLVSIGLNITMDTYDEDTIIKIAEINKSYQYYGIIFAKKTNLSGK